ncbi:hypothetical protein B0H11DRAFT_293248 [Mycena galericulata]|nr:hypothetical protein B0H11DRAFT_293248 [Mycena galericulata]
MDDQPTSPKSLTPQRKHRKLLKDGSGTAVWPESVESLFVQGLREYWDSPWATYSRGRSRWRNQFLVDYLQNLGIVRSKKQVASHIQVLRNMWKGEPEYHLVAGGEELFPDQVKLEEQPTLLTIHDEDDAASSLSNSPPEFISEFPPSPGETTSFLPGLSYSPSSPLSSIPDLDSPPNAFSTLSTPYPIYQQKPYPTPPPPAHYHNRATSLTLLADGMTPFTIDLDRLAPPAPPPARTPPLVLRLRLAIAPVDDARAPANLHGFFASIRLASVWNAQTKVYTRAYDPAGQCFSEEGDPLHASSVELGSVVASFPESTLSRARWCDAAVQTTVTQQVVVDGAPLLFVVYELDRRPGPSALPSADLVSFQKYAGSSGQAPPNAKPQPEPTYAQYPPQGVLAYSPPTAASSFSPTYSPPSAPTYSPPYYTGAYSSQPQPQMYTHPPPSVSTYTPSLSVRAHACLFAAMNDSWTFTIRPP